MSAWLSALWPLVLGSLVLVGPGLVLACAAGARRETAWGLAPALSVSVVAVAIVVGSAAKVSWGAVPLALATALLLVVIVAFRLVLRVVRGRWPGWAGRSALLKVDPEVTGWSGLAWYGAGIIGAGLFGAYTVARGMGTPDALNQTYDSPFHINAIREILAVHQATPAVVAGVTGGSAGGFYPPAFHAVAALIAQGSGIGPIEAANVTAVVIAAVVWPASMSLLVRTLLGTTRLGLLISMVGCVLISLFPALLLGFGVLWPNALSLAVLPAVVALVARTLHIAPFTWVNAPVAAVLTVLSLPGLYYAHPGAAFVLMFVLVPMLAAAWLRAVAATWWAGGWQRATALAAGPVLFLIGWGVWLGLYGIKSLDGVRSFDWKARTSPIHAVGEVVALGSPLSSDLLIYGLLVILGAVATVRTRLWWVSAVHVMLCTFAVLAMAYETDLAQTLTGFWYNDPFRTMGPIAITAVPLAAAGAVAWRDAWQAPLARFLARTRGAETPRLAWVVSTASVTALILLLVPTLTGSQRVSHAVALGYTDPPEYLVTPAERTLYENLGHEIGPDQTILGNPWGGTVYAGVLADRPSLWNAFTSATSPDLKLLVERFKDFRTDPAVCAAVKRLKVGAVVEDTQLLWKDGGDPRPLKYPGLTGLDNVAGLTVLGRADTTTAYSVGDCRS